MPSVAAAKSVVAFERARVLREAALSLRLDKRTRHAQIYYHASLAIGVAAWDAYLNDIVMEFYSIIADPLNPKYHAVTTLSQRSAEAALKRFNTPNFDNSRALLVSYTGYDPYGDWAWHRKTMSSLHVQERLNQVLKVRHSFAHGFAIPAYSWTQSKAGKVRLTNEAVMQSEALLAHLIARTDQGLKLHVSTIYGVRLNW
jgi:hypothetical protein